MKAWVLHNIGDIRLDYVACQVERLVQPAQSRQGDNRCSRRDAQPGAGGPEPWHFRGKSV